MKEKPILEGPIFFHFHDYGRKGIFGSPIWNFGVKISLEYIDVFFCWGYPFSHNHGSVENHPLWKETPILEIHPFSTSMIMGGRVYLVHLFGISE